MNPKITINIEQVVVSYGKMVSTICRRMIYDERLAEDAAQEAWIEVFKSFSAFKGESKLSTWIYTITARTAAKYLKNERAVTVKEMKHCFDGHEFISPYCEDFDEKLWVKEMCDKCLTGMLRCLDIEARLIYIFRDIAELKYCEVSQIIEKDETAIRKIASRSRQKLRCFVNDECMLTGNSAKCKCRMKRWVEKINLADEYLKIRKSVWKINLYRAYENILPAKNYWEDLIK